MAVRTASTSCATSPNLIVSWANIVRERASRSAAFCHSSWTFRVELSAASASLLPNSSSICRLSLGRLWSNTSSKMDEAAEDDSDCSGKLRVQFALEAVGGARHFLKTAAVARFVIPFCFGIATGGEIDPFRRFEIGRAH